MERFDIVIIGSGVAGLSAALAAAPGARALIVSKDALEESNTRYAQGGIAAALSADDSADAHLEDTLAAGGGLVERGSAAVLTNEAHTAIEELVRLGVPFDRDRGGIALGREAAHSAARIVHAGGDATGAHLERTLAGSLRSASVEWREFSLVTRLLTGSGRVTGVEILDCSTGAVSTVEAQAVILATGGAGQLYTHTTNPAVATGDGVALACRAGAEVMDLEFIQFHPTALHLSGAPAFLISEAVRGEGAILRDCHGRAFMTGYDSRAELAPRDIIARAIQSQMALTESPSVFLDLTHLPAEHIRSRFPQIDSYCRSFGLDMTDQLIPVAPAAHYTMGGVRTTPWGETNIRGLFACGEVACTGVHGANRLASNSLLEGLVFGRRAALCALADIPPPEPVPGAIALDSPERAEAGAPALRDLQRLMWENAGIVRDAAGLERACCALSAWQADEEAAGRTRQEPTAPHRATWELSNLILVGRLVAEAARGRTESRGAHFRSDYPGTLAGWWRHQIYRMDPRVDCY